MRNKPELITSVPEDFAQKISSLHVYIARMVFSRYRLDKTVAGLEAELAVTRERVLHLNALIDAITRSHSWKLTAPLRAVTAWLRKLRKPIAGIHSRAVRAPQPDSTSIAAHKTTSLSSPAVAINPTNELLSARPKLTGDPDLAGPHKSKTRPVSEEAVPSDSAPFENGGKEAWDLYGQIQLRKFLARDEKLVFPFHRKPQVSVIVVLFNKVHLSLMTFRSLNENADVSYELIIVDNNSSDETHQLLDRLQHVTVIRNTTNAGFAAGCMQGVDQCNGEYLCFLNNDALLQQGAFSAAISNFRDPSTGAVGGKILLANGKLQEAGCILWCSGTTEQYGRGDNPQKLQYNFGRPVDYCSGVFLCTPTMLFNNLGGFDQRFALGYWEDTDYCLRLWQNGYRVMYEPRSVIRHYESASSATVPTTLDHIITNHEKFVEKWKSVLPYYYEPDPSNHSAARVSTADDRLRILFVDERIPHKLLSADFARSFQALSHLKREGIVACAAFDVQPVPADREDVALEVEFVDATHERTRVLVPYLRDADVVWTTRERIARELISLINVTGRRKVLIVLDDGVEHPTERQLPDVLIQHGLPSDQLQVIREESITIPLLSTDECTFLPPSEQMNSELREFTVTLCVVS